MVKNTFRKYIGKIFFKKCQNMVEATAMAFWLLKLMGYQVLGLISPTKTTVVSKFSYFGFCMYIFWYSLYLYCFSIAFQNDQTVLRLLFNTRLKQYGEMYEKAVAIVYVVYLMWKLPFSLHNDPKYARQIFQMDELLEKLGVLLDYNKHVLVSFTIGVAQYGVYYLRLFTIWYVLHKLDMSIPYAKIYQGVYPDTLSFVITSCYCYYLMALRERHTAVNDVLRDIKESIRPLEKSEESRSAAEIQDVCEKIRLCAKINTIMYAGSETINKHYGFTLFITMLSNISYIVLYMFYFMEATAAGLYLDLQRYVSFLTYVFWQVLYAVVIFISNVYFAESTVREAKKTSFIVHEIVNCDFSPEVTNEARQFSMQLLHLVPKFTASGLYTLDYTLLQEGARSVLTFLVILLQFVTDPQSYI
ncbi:putative gustatory receptor 28b [Achroia grisella]|uniref:putative gustatory receptor 28b n=1 Tax=Achroia grisella TaxID=688607 RepID=UPI0027D2EE88|nr:putative gustatory receptor 28b [Achroia grisella]